MPYGMPQLPGQGPIPGVVPSGPSNPPTPANAAATGFGLDTSTQQQILLIKALADQGVPFDKIPALIQSLTAGAAGAGQGPPPSMPLLQNPYAAGQAWGNPSVKPGDQRNQNYDNVRSPPRYNGRSRSRSPDRGWGGRGSPHNGPDRQDYGHKSPSRGRYDDRRGGDYRQRSPHGRRGRSPSPAAAEGHGEKWVEYDQSVPSGNIKVYSRTLFVGGVT